MDHHIDRWIARSEEKWLQQLQHHSTTLFAGKFLPSHDQSHHQRVWNICKAMLIEISRFNGWVDQDLVEGLLVAAWFHDMGMALHMEKEHGMLGRKICEEFFRDHGFPTPLRYGELLEAIEKHDLKESSLYAVFVPETPPGILNILSIADDLDAMGTIGIYRYAEIYLHRKVSLQGLGIPILKDARNRNMNMVSSCRNCPALVGLFNQQYADLVEFYNLYNQQLLVEEDPAKVFRGHLGIVNYIRRLGVEERVRPEQFFQQLDPEESGKMAYDYFKKLRDELEKARR